jgi:hypothetical protein
MGLCQNLVGFQKGMTGWCAIRMSLQTAVAGGWTGFR